MSEKLNNTDWCFYQFGLFEKRKNQLSLKIKNSTILIIFEIISLKWIKSLTIFYQLEKTLCQNCNLWHPGFTYSVCGPFIKHRGRIHNLQRQEI